MYSVNLVPVTSVDDVWPHIADGLEDSCQRTGGDLCASYLWGECRGGHAYLFVIASEAGIEGASVWRFEKWSSGKKFRCIALYASKNTVEKWLDEHKRVAEECMRAGGAESCVGEGRPWKTLIPEAKLIKQTYEWIP